MKKSLSKPIIVLLLIIFGISGLVLANELYYGFYASSKGPKYKEFRHNIFGFSVDVPTDWMFGVITKDNIPVILFYPQGLDTAKFSPDYETIEIGQIPLSVKVSLDDAQKYVLDGMRMGHQNYELLKDPAQTLMNGLRSVNFLAKWQSKTGFDIYEYIFLVDYVDQVRTIAVRTTFDVNKKINFYNEIINSYRPFKKVSIEGSR